MTVSRFVLVDFSYTSDPLGHIRLYEAARGRAKSGCADLLLNVALTNSAIASPDIIGKWQWQNRQNQPSSRFWR
jgi:hypothetical protein